MITRYLRNIGLPVAALLILAPTSRNCGSPIRNTDPKNCFETSQGPLDGPLPRFSIIGENNIEAVSQLMTVQDPSIAGTRHVGRMLFWKLSAAAWYQCTVFLISKNHVLTAAHCGSVVTSYKESLSSGLADGTLDMIIDGTGLDPKAAYIEFNRLYGDKFFAPAGSPEIYFVDSIAVKLTSVNGKKIDVGMLRLSRALNKQTGQLQAAGDVWGYFYYYSFKNFARPTQLYHAGFGVVTPEASSPFNGQYMHIDRSAGCQITPECQPFLNPTTLQVPDSCDLKKGDSRGPVVDKNTGIAFGVNTSEVDEVPINQTTSIAGLQFWWDRRAPWGVFDATEDDL